MVEMHYVVVNVLRADHEVANQLGIRRNLGADGILHGADRCNAVNERAHAADTLCKRPGIPWVAVAKNDLDAAHHRAGGIGLLNLIAIHLCLDAQMAFDACDRIYDDSSVHALPSSRFSATISMRLPIL